MSKNIQDILKRYAADDKEMLGMILSNRIDYGSDNGALISIKQFEPLSEDIIAWHESKSGWIDANHRLPNPGDYVMMRCAIHESGSGKEISWYCFGHYFTKRFKTVEVEDWDDTEDLDVDEELGQAWLKEGWYELVEQISFSADNAWMDRNVTHWMPAPKQPK